MSAFVRSTPGFLCPEPTSKAGLRGKTAVDMRAQRWGVLTALRQGSCAYWWFRCGNPAHPEFLLNGATVRQQSKRGIDPVCQMCAKEKVR